MPSDIDTLSDEQLVEQLQETGSRDLRSFDVLVDRHQQKVLANCRYLTRSPDDAEDLAQEVFVKAYFGIRRFRGESKFRTWLQRIKVNHCLNFLKKKRREPEKVELDEAGVAGVVAGIQREPIPERSLQAADARERIAAVLDEMSETLRIALLMRDMDELAYSEIAQQLGIGLSAAKMRIKRGREEFRRMYREMWGEDDAPGGSEGVRDAEETGRPPSGREAVEGLP